MAKFWGIFFSVAWISGQIFRWPGWPPVTILDVAVVGMVIANLREIRGVRGIRGISLILVVSWILGLRLFSLGQSISGGLYLVRFLGYVWVIVNAGRLLFPVKKFIFPAFWIFVILAWAQYFLLPDTRFLLKFGWDEHYYRMIGMVLDPNYLGVMLGMIGVYAMNKEEGEKIWNRSNTWLAVMSLVGLAVTFSRASWLALIVVSCWLLVVSEVFRKKLGRLGGLGILGIIGIIGMWLAVPKSGGEGINLWRTNSIEQRIESWREGINVWREHPWVGVGFNNYAAVMDKVQESTNHAGNAPSSSWILLLATVGAIGVGGLGVIGGIRGIGEIAKNKLWIGILAMIGIHSIFNNTMFYPPVLGLLALIKAASAD